MTKFNYNIDYTGTTYENLFIYLFDKYPSVYSIPTSRFKINEFITEDNKTIYLRDELMKLGFQELKTRNSMTHLYESSDLPIYLVHEEAKILLYTNSIIYPIEYQLESNVPIFNELKDIYRKFLSLPSIRKNKCGIILQNNYGFFINDFDIKEVNVDINKHYNDSFKEPYLSILEGLRNDEDNSLFLFRSEPGCGKTYLIRHLISQVKEKEFIYLAPTLLEQLDNPQFLPFAIENLSDKILIVEDGEKILQKRQNGNGFVSTLLNLSDGILNDLLNLKIIVTINCSIDEIDPALMRKGRIHTFYEFGPLDVDKCRNLGFDVNEPTKISDLYNDSSITEISIQRPIGFR